MRDDGKPETLYELCEQVCEAIAASPTNYYQGHWSCDAKTKFGAEACGTAYCRAGWIVAIMEGPQRHEHTADGIIAKKAYDLFAKAGITKLDLAQFENGLFSGIAVNGAPGSAKYVEEGVAGMRRFMDKYEDKLKRCKL